jgi:hypothetical protein
MPNVYSASTGPRVALSAVLSTKPGVAVAASNSTYSSGTVVLSGNGNMTVSYNAGTVLLSAGVGAGGGVAIANGAATITSGTAVFSNSNGVTFGLNGQTVTASAGYRVSSYTHNSLAFLANAFSVIGAASASIVHVPIPQEVSFSRLDVHVSFQTASSATAATAAVAFSNVAVIYTRNGSTLNPIVGASNTITVSWVSNTGIASSATGPRLLSFGLATALTPGNYWVGVHISTTSGISSGAATTALNGSLSIIFPSIVGTWTGTNWGDFNGTTHSSSSPLLYLQGLISSALTATGQTLQASQITQSGTFVPRAGLVIGLKG